FTDLSEAARRDDIALTVDYAAVAEAVRAAVESSPHHLLEGLAERVAAVCLATRRVRGVRVRVDKPAALRGARSAGVEIFRRADPDG
ncbi:MAG: dihydroneopterin aldolase, partial [Planctomycetes bacterium]|nr:dihydroneopterin aldolase [Planctomycetota bacterium]